MLDWAAVTLWKSADEIISGTGLQAVKMKNGVCLLGKQPMASFQAVQVTDSRIIAVYFR